MSQFNSQLDRLESWKSIAGYLHVSIRTAQLWEKERGLPIRRQQIGRKGIVFAYRTDLRKWLNQTDPPPEDESDLPEGLKLLNWTHLLWLSLGVLVLIWISIAIYHYLLR